MYRKLSVKGRARVLESRLNMKMKTRKSNTREPELLKAIESPQQWISTFKLFPEAFATQAKELIDFLIIVNTKKRAYHGHSLLLDRDNCKMLSSKQE